MDLQWEKYGLSFDIKKKFTSSGWALGDESVIGMKSYKNKYIKAKTALSLEFHVQQLFGIMSAYCNKNSHTTMLLFCCMGVLKFSDWTTLWDSNGWGILPFLIGPLCGTLMVGGSYLSWLDYSVRHRWLGVPTFPDWTTLQDADGWGS